MDGGGKEEGEGGGNGSTTISRVRDIGSNWRDRGGGYGGKKGEGA